jgi:hypothetical protein
MSAPVGQNQGPAADRCEVCGRKIVVRPVANRRRCETCVGQLALVPVSGLKRRKSGQGKRSGASGGDQ